MEKFPRTFPSHNDCFRLQYVAANLSRSLQLRVGVQDHIYDEI